MGPDDFSVRRPAGPERPAWLQRDADDAGPSRGALSNAIGEGSAIDRVKSGLKVKRNGDSKLKLHKKKEKKPKKEKRHKEKKRRKKEKG